MESSINARAIDIAKFGRLFLHNGNWNGIEVIPAEWVVESTQADTSVDYANYYYDDFIALGNLGQYIYISPQKNLTILRFGESYGEFGNSLGWLELFYRFATNLDE